MKIPYRPFNFLGMPESQANIDNARILVMPVPYDSTTSYKSGARDGPHAIIEASRELEDFDPEMGYEISSLGIYTADELEPHLGNPLKMAHRVKTAVSSLIRPDTVVATLGGDHSISIGATWAHQEVFTDLSVLYLDAHADLRDKYMSTSHGHASVARRIFEFCPLVLAGIRSLSSEEQDFISTNSIPYFPWSGSYSYDDIVLLASEIISNLSSHVYISLDLDVLDPSIMSAVGTPEPGGLSWWELLTLLREISSKRHIVGFDLTELSPKHGPESCAYIAAKLAYKLMAYSILSEKNSA